jgi:hypothetical protein
LPKAHAMALGEAWQSREDLASMRRTARHQDREATVDQSERQNTHDANVATKCGAIRREAGHSLTREVKAKVGKED